MHNLIFGPGHANNNEQLSIHSEISTPLHSQLAPRNSRTTTQSISHAQYQLARSLAMNTKDGESSGFGTCTSLPNCHSFFQLTSKASPDMPPTPATSHQLRRSLSQLTLATTMSVSSDASSMLSLNYPNAPLNTPATQSMAGDEPMSNAADLKVLTDRLEHTTVSPSTGEGEGEGEEDPFKEGKAHLRTHVREDADLSRQLFKSPESKRPVPKHELLRKYGGAADRSVTPTRLRMETAAAAAAPPTFEYDTWSPIAEEDTERALKRMAMLARDEHSKDPRHTVVEYYSMRLAKLIDEAEVAFDATHLH
jgi:hypothetical protein